MKKLCVVATIPEVVYSFMQSHIRAAAEKWPVTIVSRPGGAEIVAGMGAQFAPVSFHRKIAPLHDVYAFIQLLLLFRRNHFDLVHSIMPKTGLLAMMAARLAGVPNRVHTFTGQVWANKCGWRRRLLKMFDKLIVLFATHIIVDSPSQREFLLKEGVLTPDKGLVIGSGSICGVDTRRFQPDAAVRAAVRKELHIGSAQTVILFLGRLNVDKGIPELAQAFVDLVEQGEDVMLLLVGPEEDFPFARVQEICGAHVARLRRAGYTPCPERYMAAADIFCLPSHREGFGQVIIEAAACGVPVVASNIYGITDAVADGKTGMLFPAGNVAMLARNLTGLARDIELRKIMGEQARQRVLALFDSKEITKEMMAIYGGLLEQY